MGLASFATRSNGEKIDNPQFFREDENALAKAQSKCDKLPKGSSLRRKASKVVTRIHENPHDPLRGRIKRHCKIDIRREKLPMPMVVLIRLEVEDLSERSNM